jgi:methylisocitrate lyase
MTEFGKTPIINFSEFERVGYSCVIYPVSTLRAAMGAVQLMLEGLKETGSVEGSLEKMLTRKGLYELLNYKPGQEWIFPGTKSKKD